MSNSSWSISKEDIDPSEFHEEELKEIIFNGLRCAKVVESLATSGEGGSESFWAYYVIRHFDEVPHERTPSDIIQEEALEIEGRELKGKDEV